MKPLTDEQVGLATPLTDAEVGLTQKPLSDAAVGLVPQTFVPDYPEGFIPDLPEGFIPDAPQSFIPDSKPINFGQVTPQPSYEDNLARASRDFRLEYPSGVALATPTRQLTTPGDVFRTATTSLIPKSTPQERLLENARQMGLAEEVSPSPTPTAAELQAARQPEQVGTATKVGRGVVAGIEDLAEGFTSPIGIATLGMGSLPVATQRAISLAFAAQMITGAPDLAKQLGDEFGKPPAQRDPQRISQLIIAGAGTVGFTSLAAKHGLAEPAAEIMGATPRASVSESTATPTPTAERPGEPTPQAPAAPGLAPTDATSAFERAIDAVSRRSGVPAPELVDTVQRALAGQSIEVGPSSSEVETPDLEQARIESVRPSVTQAWLQKAAPRTEAAPSPKQEKIIAATYTDPQTGLETTARNHIAAAAEQGVQAPQERQGRETPDYGFKTDTGRTVSRDEAHGIASTAGQVTRQPGPGEKFHSDMLTMPADTTGTTEPRAAAPVSDTGTTVQARAGRTGRRFFVGPRPDGNTDILDAIQELGGIKPPTPDDLKTGDFDGYQEAMVGPARLLANRSSRNRPDTIIDQLQSAPWNFQRIQSTSQLWDAIGKAVAEREGLRAGGGTAQDKEARFWEAAQNPKNPAGLVRISVDDLKVGHKFRLKGPGVTNEELEVVGIDPETGEVTVKDGRVLGTQTLPEGTEIWVQRRFAPADVPTKPAAPMIREQPETFELNQPESVEEQKARQAREEAERVKQAQREELDRRQAAPLVGTTGDIGQGDLLGGGDLLSAPSPKPDRIESLLNRAIEATKPKTGLQTGEVGMGLAKLPVWLSQELAHGSLKVVRASYRAGKALSEAVTDGINWLRSEAGKSFNEKQARDWLEWQTSQEPPQREWEEIRDNRDKASGQFNDYRQQVDAAGGRQRASIDLKNKMDDAKDAWAFHTRMLRKEPGYVEDLLKRFTETQDQLERENIQGELTMLEPSLLNKVYQDMQQRGVIPQSQPLPEPFSSLQALTDWLRAHEIQSPRPSIRERIKFARRAVDTLTDIRDKAKHWWLSSIATAKQQWESFLRPPVDDDFRTINKDWQLWRQKSGFETAQWMDVIRSKIPKSDRRWAVIAYNQAGGNLEILRYQLSQVPERYKPMWEAALSLTPTEIDVANEVGADWAQKLEIAKNAGMVEEGRQNYGPIFWETPPKAVEGDSTFAMSEQRKGTAGNPNARLDTRDPFFSFHSEWPTYFDGIMAGGKPETMDVGVLVGRYNQAFNTALGSRTAVRSLLDAKAARDGRPAVILSGHAQVIDEGTPGLSGKGYIVDSKYRGKEAQSQDGRAYISLDHPSLKGWKFVLRTENGKPIITRADMLVHPDYAPDLENILGGKRYIDKKTGKVYGSWFRQYKLGRGLLWANRFAKESLVGLSPFHMATLGEEALSHTVSPIPWGYKIDLQNNPVQRRLVRAGVDIGFSGERVDAQEGLASNRGGLLGLIPGVGDAEVMLSDLTFKRYLPAIKMSTAEAMLNRNLKKYSGRYTEEQIYDFTASQANAAFGIQNQQLIARSPTTRDLLSLVGFAPDFLESRLKVIGQALKPYGAEQRRALLMQAVGMYVIARTLNWLWDDEHDPHWKVQDAFRFYHKGRVYTIRANLSDAMDLMTDGGKFITGRESVLTRTGIELSTQRNWTGIKRTRFEQLEDSLANFFPMWAQGLVPGSSGRDTSLPVAAGRAVGIMSRRATAGMEIRDLAEKFNRKSADPEARAWQKARDQETLPESRYRKLDTLLEENDLSAAKKEYDRLIKDGNKSAAIAAHYRSFRPFTGTRVRDQQFLQTLGENDRQRYDQAQQDQRDQLQRFMKMLQQPSVTP